MVSSIIQQRFVVRNTFLELTCEQEELEKEIMRRRCRSFTDAGIRYDADDNCDAKSESSTTASGSFCDSSQIHTPLAEDMWGGSLEATASALVAAAEHLASQARAARAAAASARVAAMGIDTASCTTVMLRNLPKNLTQVAVLQTLQNHGFAALYDFVYLPVDFQKMVSFGYAVVNFVSHEAAEKAMQYFTGFTEWPMPSRKACTTVWNTPCQGLASHIERYRDSPLMHPTVAPEFKPMLLAQGFPVAFPMPTKQLKAPPRLPQKNAPSKAPVRVARKVITSKTF